MSFPVIMADVEYRYFLIVSLAMTVLFVVSRDPHFVQGSSTNSNSLFPSVNRYCIQCGWATGQSVAERRGLRARMGAGHRMYLPAMF